MNKTKLLINLIRNIFKRKKEREKNPRQELKESAIKKLEKLQRKKFKPEVFDDFVWIFRVFISNILKINYEFTHKELLHELDHKKIKVKKEIIQISETIKEINYLGKKIEKDEFKKIIEETKKIIKSF